MKLVLVACSSRKAESYRAARELYTSPLFRLSAAWAARNGDRWAILSAKHGIVAPDAVLEPYELSLLDLDLAGVTRWADAVAWGSIFEQPEGGELVVLAGKLYLSFAPRLETRFPGRWKVTTPLAGMQIDERLSWLSTAQARAEREAVEAGATCGVLPGSFRARQGVGPCVLAAGHVSRRHQAACGRWFTKSIPGGAP